MHVRVAPEDARREVPARIRRVGRRFAERRVLRGEYVLQRLRRRGRLLREESVRPGSARRRSGSPSRASAMPSSVVLPRRISSQPFNQESWWCVASSHQAIHAARPSGGGRMRACPPTACSCSRRPAARARAARMLLSRDAGFELARRVRGEGAPLGEVFSFVSALYFRGKLAYAQRFAAPPDGCPGVLVITPDRGLRRAGDRDHDPRPARLRARADRRRPSSAMRGRSGRRAGAARADAGARRDRAARQHRDTQVRRRAAGGVRRVAALPGRLRRPRRHEPGRACCCAPRARARSSATGGSPAPSGAGGDRRSWSRLSRGSSESRAGAGRLVAGRPDPLPEQRGCSFFAHCQVCLETCPWFP